MTKHLLLIILLSINKKIYYKADSFLLTKLPVLGMIYDRKW
ncbi:hypothetical protein G159_01080 [Planococcus glaciei CHR43]|nr:hypothetical protein G159_01080 [Planococcus glaciei CHR43]